MADDFEIQTYSERVVALGGEAVINHNLGTQYLIAQLYVKRAGETTFKQVIGNISIRDENSLIVDPIVDCDDAYICIVTVKSPG